MKITVVTPTLNGAAYLVECIESVQRQSSTTVSVEHLVVDGGSVDGTLRIAQSYPDLRVIAGRDNGIYDALDRGYGEATGDLVGFLGADDVLLDGALDRVAQAYAGGDSGWVTGGVRWIDGQGRDLGGVAAPPRWMTAAMQASLGWCCIHNMATYMTKDFYRELGGFAEGYRISADFELFSRALEAQRFERIGAPLAGYRRTGENASIKHRAVIERIERVGQAFAPRNAAKRRLYRLVMKLWLNGTNPGWALTKMPATRDGLAAGMLRHLF